MRNNLRDVRDGEGRIRLPNDSSASDKLISMVYSKTYKNLLL